MTTGRRPSVGKGYTVKIGADGKPKMVRKVTFRKSIAQRKQARKAIKVLGKGKPLL